MKTSHKFAIACTLLCQVPSVFAASLCSTVLVPSVQIEVKRDAALGDELITPVLRAAGSQNEIPLSSSFIEGTFTSDFLSVGDYVLTLESSDAVLLIQKFTLVKGASCIIAPFINQYTCSKTATDKLSCAADESVVPAEAQD